MSDEIFFGRKIIDIVTLCLIALWIIIFLFLYESQKKLEYTNAKVTSVAMANGGYSRVYAEHIILRNTQLDTPYHLAMWSCMGIVQTENLDIGRVGCGELYSVKGDTSLICHTVLDLEMINPDGCIIGESVARELFGQVDVIGMSLSINGIEYRIEDVLREEKNAIIVCDFDDANYNMLTTEIAIDYGLISTDIDITNQLGFDGKIMDYRIINDMFHLLSFIMYVGVYGFWCRTLINKIKNNEKKNGILTILIWFFGSVIFIYFIFDSIRFNVDCIPTKWSDFEFWSGFIEDKKERLYILIACEKRIYLYESFVKSFQMIVLYLFWYVIFFLIQISCFWKKSEGNQE